MAKSKTQVTIAVDSQRKVTFYYMTNGEKSMIRQEEVTLKRGLFDDKFYEALTQEVRNFREKRNFQQKPAVTLVLPDNMVAMDTISVPTIRSLRGSDALNTTMRTLYRNLSDLKVNKQQLESNRQTTTYSIAMLRQTTYAEFYKALASAQMAPDIITFAGNAAANGAQAISSRLRGSSYLLMDVKLNKTQFAFVNRGRVVGAYSLDFGYETLNPSRVLAENLVVNHPVAELAVVNAKEKAKAKQLSTMDFEGLDGEESEDSGEFSFQDSENGTTKVLPKKTARKLPNFMQRPTPEDEDGYICENFRLLQKWALNLLRENKELYPGSAAESVFVNIPEEYDCVFERMEQEKDENGIPFAKMGDREELDVISGNLELYGGFFAGQYNKNNNF